MSKLTLCTLDIESFWSTQHTLSRMSPIEYVTHPETELISISFKFGADKTYCIFGEDTIANWASQVDWSELLVVGHNMSRFDSMILAWRLGVRPGMWGCTLSMATPHHAKTCGLSLGALVEHYGVGKKDNSALINTRGKHLKDFTADEIARMRAYNIADTDQCYALFKRLLKVTPTSEMKLIDHTIRMLVEPQFEVDRPLLAETLVLERERKEKVLLDLAKLLDPARAHADPDGASLVVEKMLGSAAKFADFLRSQGVEVPMKLSQRTGKWAPALAKTDEAFLELQEHENELVAEAAAARLGVKSTILESRLQALITAGDAVGGKLPVPLKYYGADTTGRWSGWAYNCMPAGHEVLTPGGWVDIAEWEPGTPIMQWWPGGSMTWCHVAGKVEHHHVGAMVRLEGPFVRGLFTPDHRIPKVTKTKTSTRNAGWVAAHSGLDGVPAAGVYAGGVSHRTPSQVRLLVAMAADGCVTKEGSIRWGFKRQRKIDRITQLLAACGIDGARTYDYRDSGGYWVAVLAKGNVPTWLTKGFGPWVLELSRGALDAFVDELKYWDGMEHSSSGNTCFFTNREDQAQWVSTALHLSGTPARVGARSAGRFDVYARSSARTSTHGSFEQFDGVVYCPQVDSSFFLVRHDGAIHVTGNCQNFPRISPDKPKLSDALRKSLKAPKGKKVIVADLSGIELRTNMFLWQVPYAMELFQRDPEKADLYRYFAANQLYNCAEDAITKDQRQVGKVSHLGLGFGAGAPTFQKVARLMAKIKMPLKPVDPPPAFYNEHGEWLISAEEYWAWKKAQPLSAEEVVNAYREGHPEIVQGWKTCHKALKWIANGEERPIDPWELCWTCAEGIRTPKGLIRYPDLRQELVPTGERDPKTGELLTDEAGEPLKKLEWVYGRGRNQARIYAGKVTENIVQHLARHVVADYALEFAKTEFGRKYPLALTVHDELVYVVDEADAEPALAKLQEIMRTPVPWWPQLVTWSEGDIADTYGDAK